MKFISIQEFITQYPELESQANENKHFVCVLILERHASYEMFEWLKENINLFSHSIVITKDGVILDILFLETQEDALAFKLNWG